MQFSPEEVYASQHQVQSRSEIKHPKLELSSISGDPLKWPERSSLFLATVDGATVDKSVKMNHLKILVEGKAKAAIAGMG